MAYPSDMNDKQWALIRNRFDIRNYGKSLKYGKKTLKNAVFYIANTLKMIIYHFFWRMSTLKLTPSGLAQGRHLPVDERGF
ncbi:MAG: hypothetical protein ACRCYZ_00280 [Alphaproteobacteria bacterium]